MSLLRRIRIQRRPSPPQKLLHRSHKHISCPPSLPAPASDLHHDNDDDDTAPPQISPFVAAPSSVSDENPRLLFLRMSALVLIIMVAFFSVGKTASLLLTLAVASACKVLTQLRRDRRSSRSDMEEEEEDEEEDDLYDFTDVGFLRISRNRNHPRKKLQRLNCIRMKKLPDGEVFDEEVDASLSLPDTSAGWSPLGDGDLSGAENCRESTVKKKAMKKNRNLFFKYLQQKEEEVSRSAPSSPPCSPTFIASSSSEPVSAVLRHWAGNPAAPSAARSGIQASGKVQEKQAKNHNNTPISAARLGFQGTGRPYQRQGKVRSMEEATEGKARGRRKKGKKKVRRGWGIKMVVAGGVCVAMAGLLLGNRIVAIAALSCFWYSPRLIRRLFSLSQ